MTFTLEGLRELSRVIEVRAELFQENARKAIDEEVEYLYEKILEEMQGRDADLRPFLKLDSTDRSIRLEYAVTQHSCSMKNGKVRFGTTARSYHNPAPHEPFPSLPQFRNQPFQDVLEREGYINISPSPGENIPVAEKEAPGIRITADFGPEAITRIKGRMGI